MGTIRSGFEDGSDDSESLKQVLGYLNFSSGAADRQFLTAIDKLFRELRDEDSRHEEPRWSRVLGRLESALETLGGSSTVFTDATQAKLVLALLREICPAYHTFHADTLGFQSPDQLFNSFFLGRAAECLLQSSPHEGESTEVIARTLRRLNDYVGYRPVPTLESRKLEPYDHECIRPIPLYIDGAGVASGRHEAVVTICLRLLREADPGLLRAACFAPERLDELAVDSRAYDFDHPANKRPNHHFGQWDAHLIDIHGFYHRFVVQRVTLDALMARVEEGKKRGDVPLDELQFEAAAVLAGTILMGSGVSGYGPDAHDSSETLSNLLVRIAAYRDAFYESLIRHVSAAHGARLAAETQRLQQPFGGARQDLNRRLTEQRAEQLQRVSLSRIYARMDRQSWAQDQASQIQVPSARMTCEIECQLAESRRRLGQAEFAKALSAIEKARATLLRAIECGALVDPWNILGFDGNFSLFPAIENSMHDYRIDDLVDLVEEMIEMYAQVWSAASSEQPAVAGQVATCFESFANWWHQFAAHELDSVEAENPQDVFEAAGYVAEALAAWRQRGESAGDISFWAPYVENFSSCRAYWLVINTLLDRDDRVASLGLLMHWLGASDRVSLEHGESSFFALSLRWIEKTLAEAKTSYALGDSPWHRLRRFFDHVEANAGDYWDVPEFAPSEFSNESSGGEDHGANDEAFADEEQEEDDDELFGAAYENVVYRDSTADGVEGNVFDFDTQDEDYLQQVSRPLVNRLIFLDQLASIWKAVVVAWTSSQKQDLPGANGEQTVTMMSDLLASAATHLTRTSERLDVLLDTVSRYRLARTGSEPEAMAQYDRLRLMKDSIIDQIIRTHVSVWEGRQFVLACIFTNADRVDWKRDNEDHAAMNLLRAALHGDSQAAAVAWGPLREQLDGEPILYVPLTRGGPSKSIVAVKARQRLIQGFLHWMPRLGLLKETYELIELIREMERMVPVGPGAITEFDDLFEVGCRSIVNIVLDSADVDGGDNSEEGIVAHLQEIMEPLLRSWLSHSRTLRLSVLEQVIDEEDWQDLKQFIQRFGRDLFTQRFLSLGNIRGILHQGVEHWIEILQDYSSEECYEPLLESLDTDLSISEAVDHLTLILEAIIESYSEYRDYNSTTTQSDRGELLFTLLDFLRLRVSYDRVVWNLRPIILAHQGLVSRGHERGAEQWRQRLQEQIHGEAQRHLRKLLEMQRRYAMRLPSVEKRINEKFMRPLLIDRLCALVRPAICGETPTVREEAFAKIHEQANAFLQEPSGAGLDVPTWLVSMEEEVRQVIHEGATAFERLIEAWMLPPKRLTFDQIQDEVSKWSTDD